MNILVIGANGQIGKKLVDKIHSNSPHDAIAMVRDESQKDQFERRGIKTVLGDLEKDFELIIEPYVLHPQLKSERQFNDISDFDAPVFYDVSVPEMTGLK